MFLKYFIVFILLTIFKQCHCQGSMWTFSDRVVNYLLTIDLTSSTCDLEINEYLLGLSNKEKWSAMSEFMYKII